MEEEKEEETGGGKNERDLKKGLLSVVLRFKGGVNKKIIEGQTGKVNFARVSATETCDCYDCAGIKVKCAEQHWT